MRPPATQILDTALALHRAPGERFRLRERPVPQGLVHVLEVAAGSPQALAAAAEQVGEPEDVVLEATRFYLEQVLFADQDADAYRILGVPPDAPTDLIRTHHRWLQRWLHPDRAQAGDASVYATRVNQAWATLRSPKSRHQYDVKLAEARLAGASAPLPATTVRYWEGEEIAPNHGRRSRWLLATALVACAVLAVLIVRHEQGPQAWSPPEVAEAKPAALQPAIEDRDLGILTEAIAAAGTPAETEPVAARAALTGEVTPTAPAPLGPTQARLPAPQPVEAAQAATLPPQKLVGPAHTATIPPPEPKFATTPSTPVEPTHGRLPPTPPPLAAAPPTPPPVGAAPAATPAPAPVSVGVAMETQADHGSALQVPEPPTVLLERMHKAEQRVAQLTAYLAAQPGAAPLWNDLQTAQSAERIRARIAAKTGAELQLATPNWQLQRDNASLSVDYRCAGCRVRQGRIDVQLVWREGLWLVRGIGLAPSA